MSQIRHLLVTRITSQLQTEMIDKIPRSDPSRAVLVQSYRFQQDPLASNIYLYVTAGNPSDTNMMDARFSADNTDNLQMQVPYGEVGGGHYWWRRGIVWIGCYFIVSPKFTQIQAADTASSVLGRALLAIEQTQVADLVDSFGERAYQLMVYANNFYEGGGPPDQYIWRGEIRWQALTRRPV